MHTHTHTSNNINLIKLWTQAEIEDILIEECNQSGKIGCFTLSEYLASLLLTRTHYYFAELRGSLSLSINPHFPPFVLIAQPPPLAPCSEQSALCTDIQHINCIPSATLNVNLAFNHINFPSPIMSFCTVTQLVLGCL